MDTLLEMISSSRSNWNIVFHYIYAVHHLSIHLKCDVALGWKFGVLTGELRTHVRVGRYSFIVNMMIGVHASLLVATGRTQRRANLYNIVVRRGSFSFSVFRFLEKS